MRVTRCKLNWPRNPPKQCPSRDAARRPLTAHSESLDMAKWVYTFGDGAAEGAADKRNLLGRQGREPRRNGQSRPAGAARLHDLDRGLHLLLRQRQDLSEGARRAGEGRARACRRASPAASFGDANNPLLVSVRSGARASMPGMMDTVLNLGLNDETVEAPREDVRRPPLRLRQLSPLHHDVFGRRARRRPRALRGDPRRLTRTRTATRSTPTSTADDWAELIKRYKARVKEEIGEDFPQDPAQAALGRDRRGVRLLDERAREHLSPPAQHSGKLGHRRQRAGDGVRQHGRHVGDRRCVHAQSLDRREARSTANS